MPTRRDFLDAGVAASALTLAQAPVAAAAAAASVPAAAATPFAYDLASVATRLARPAQHRQVLSSARVAEGIALGQAEHVFDAYEHAYGEGPGTVHIAIVLYSRGAGIGLKPEVWKKYAIGELLKAHGDSVDAGDGNPYEAQLTKLATRGATYLVCDNALDGLAELLAKNHPAEGNADAMHAMLRASLVPGAFLVPAGVAAINQAQEAHFTLLVSAL